MKKETYYTVIGAGNGGKAMAAHLALKGFPVTLYNRTASRVQMIKELGGIRLESYEGGPYGFGKLRKVTSNPKEAVAEADIIMVVVPSSAHRDIARNFARHLRDWQIVLLHPGRTCGAIEFRKVLMDNGCTADVTVAFSESRMQFPWQHFLPLEQEMYWMPSLMPMMNISMGSTCSTPV
jgi:opine dehydrogenase